MTAEGAYVLPEAPRRPGRRTISGGLPRFFARRAIIPDMHKPVSFGVVVKSPGSVLLF